MTTIVHITGFFVRDSKRVANMGVSTCPVGETPYDAFVRVKSNIEHFGGTVTRVNCTWPIGGRRRDAVRIEFESPARGLAARMWHVVTAAPADEWAAMPPVETGVEG